MTTEELAVKLQETKDRSLRNEGRIKKLENEHEILQNLATSVAVMSEQMRTMNGNVALLTGKVDKLEGRPGKRWDGLVDKIITGIAAALLGFILAKIGL